MNDPNHEHLKEKVRTEVFPPTAHYNHYTMPEGIYLFIMKEVTPSWL